MRQLDGVGGSSASASDAMRTFRVACDMHEGAGCGFAGDLLMQEMVAGGQSQAANLYYDGCKYGNARSCMAQATMLNQAAVAAAGDGSVKGEHAMHAKARSIMFFRRACELGNAQGCNRFFKAHDALRILDTRSEDEKSWLSVTPEIADGPRTPESLQKAVYDK